jgi:hypothetical protein
MSRRTERIRPLLDDKMLLSWNALMNTACSKAYAALGEIDYRDIAIKNMQFLEDKFSGADNGQWYHTYKNNQAKYPAFLDDYAYLVEAYIHLQEISGDWRYLTKVKAICEVILNSFQEEDSGFFYFTHKFQKDIIVRKKEVYDGATPSGNAIMASNLHYLSIVYNRSDWFEQAKRMISSLSQLIVSYPTSFGIWAINMQQMFYGLNEIAVAGKEIEEIREEILEIYIPNKVLQTTTEVNNSFPLLEGKIVKEEAEIYFCKNYACHKPVSTVNKLVEILSI